MINIEIIVAVDQNWGIGKDNKLLAHLPTDLKRFKHMTERSVVVMGRKTFDSLPKPLENRVNVVLTREPREDYDNVVFVNSFSVLLESLEMIDGHQRIFIIGGAEIYNKFLDYCDTAHVTMMFNEFEADTFFPNLAKSYKWAIDEVHKPTITENGIEYAFVTFKKRI